MSICIEPACALVRVGLSRLRGMWDETGIHFLDFPCFDDAGAEIPIANGFFKLLHLDDGALSSSPW